MARKPRIEYEGAVYHVMSRGDRKEPIYQSRNDYIDFIRTLERACLQTGWIIHAYVLMPNHYHLLLETPEKNLVAGMKWLNGTYTQRFNLRNQLVGHVFQGRYKAIPVEAGSGNYLSTVADYIHLNPARANLLKKDDPVERFQWSSFPLYCRMHKRPTWLQTEKVLGNLGLNNSVQGETQYRKYLNMRANEIITLPPQDRQNFQEEIQNSWYVGSDDFHQQLLDHLDSTLKSSLRSSLHGTAITQHGEEKATQLLSFALNKLGLAADDLSKQPKGTDDKALLAWFIRQNTTVSRAWISQRLHMGDVSRISHLIRMVEKDERFLQRKKQLRFSESEESYME